MSNQVRRILKNSKCKRGRGRERVINFCELLMFVFLKKAGAVRVMSGIGLNIGFSFAQTIFTGFAYILHDWRILMFACGVIPAILLNLIFDNFEESPRYF